MNLFVLQFDVHLAKNHEFYVEYLFWYNQPTTSEARSYDGLWRLVHDWVRRKKDTKNRKEALKDHLPNMSASNTPNGKGKGAGKGTGKDKDGKPQVCFSWRNNGVCAKKEAGTCVYAHPMDVKGKGKPGGAKGDGKRSSSNSSRTSKGGKAGGKGSDTPRKKVVTDLALLCRNFLKGKCDKGKQCKWHHNGPCTFHAKGNCNKGDDCIFSHQTPSNAAAAPAGPNAPPKKGKKTTDTNGE
jgi:hypothetical protein